MKTKVWLCVACLGLLLSPLSAQDPNCEPLWRDIELSRIQPGRQDACFGEPGQHDQVVGSGYGERTSHAQGTHRLGVLRGLQSGRQNSRFRKSG